MIMYIRYTHCNLIVWLSHNVEASQMVFMTTSSTAQGGGGSFKDRKPIGEVAGCDAWMAEQSH